MGKLRPREVRDWAEVPRVSAPAWVEVWGLHSQGWGLPGEGCFAVIKKAEVICGLTG